MVLVFMQPDLGPRSCTRPRSPPCCSSPGVRWLHLGLLLGAAALLVGSVLWFLPASGIDVLKPYQTARLTGFTNPDSDPSGLTYNVNQSITAVGAGGLEGRGVTEASQTRFDYLPEHATDFVFASFAEQRGFFGASILLLLYLLVVWRGLRVVTVAGDLYGAVVAGGIVFAFLFQVFVNVGMTMGIAPVTGIPLPFVTVGGSSMVANLVAVGILQAIHARGRSRTPSVDDAAPASAPATSSRSRGTRRAPASRGRSSSRGVLAEQLAGALRPAATASLVRTTAIPPMPSRSSGSSPATRRRRTSTQLRAAARALVPLVVVQPGTARARPVRAPADVVHVPPGAGFPLDEIAAALARALGRDGAPLAARLPVLRDRVRAPTLVDAAVTPGAIAALRPEWADLPVLALAPGTPALRPRDARRRTRFRAPRARRRGRRAAPRRRAGDRHRVGGPQRSSVACRSGPLSEGAVAARHRTLCAGRRSPAVAPDRVRPVRVLGSPPTRPRSRWRFQRAGHGARRGVAADRGGGRLVRVPRVDPWTERAALHELEPWAWARLSQRLRAVRARRARLRTAAA